MKIAAINTPLPPPPRPAGGACGDSLRGARATFAGIRDRIDLEQPIPPRPRFDVRDGEGRAAGRWAPAEAEPAAAALEIQLPREAFTATILDLAPVAGLGGRPASLAPPAPGTPAAAYARAAELLYPAPGLGAFFSAVV